MITKWEMTQVTENRISNQCVSVSYLVLCFVGWWCCFIRLLRRFVLLFISSPVCCGQISRHKAAAKHHSDFEPPVFKQTRDFRQHILIKHQKAERAQKSLSSCKGFWRVFFPYWLQISRLEWRTKLCLQQWILTFAHLQAERVREGPSAHTFP